MKLRSNLHIIGGYGERKVKAVARLPDGTVLREIEITAPGKVKERFSTHNAVTQQGQYYFILTLLWGISGSCNIPSGYSSSAPPNTGSILLTTQSGAKINVAPIVIPQVVSPTKAIIYYIAQVTVSSQTTITGAQLYVYLTLTGSSTVSTPLFELAEASVNMTLQPNLTYNLVWEVEVINNYTDNRQYNTMVWTAFMFYNSTGYMSVSGCVNGYTLKAVTSYGSQVDQCNVQYYTAQVAYTYYAVYTDNQGQVVGLLITVLNNPGQENTIMGIMGMSSTGIIGNGSQTLGCQLIVLEGLDYVVQPDPTQVPYVTVAVQVTVEEQ